jgi:hypothetical protein
VKEAEPHTTGRHDDDFHPDGTRLLDTSWMVIPLEPPWPLLVSSAVLAATAWCRLPVHQLQAVKGIGVLKYLDDDD